MTIPRHDPCPVAGYRDGLIISKSRPAQERKPNPDGKSSPLHDVINDWFYIDNSRYNVHPFRADLGGYPIRWIETLNYDDGSDIDGLTDVER